MIYLDQISSLVSDVALSYSFSSGDKSKVTQNIQVGKSELGNRATLLFVTENNKYIKLELIDFTNADIVSNLKLNKATQIWEGTLTLDRWKWDSFYNYLLSTTAYKEVKVLTIEEKVVKTNFEPVKLKVEKPSKSKQVKEKPVDVIIPEPEAVVVPVELTEEEQIQAMLDAEEASKL